MIRMGGWSDLRWKKKWSIIDQFYNESKLNGPLGKKEKVVLQVQVQ
jgi:hypothetical protein